MQSNLERGFRPESTESITDIAWAEYEKAQRVEDEAFKKLSDSWDLGEDAQLRDLVEQYSSARAKLHERAATYLESARRLAEEDATVSLAR